MKISRKSLLMFGPITLIIEWSGLFIGSRYAKEFDINRALSTLSTAPQPLPFIFGLTLTLAGLTYFLFSLALADHDRRIPVIAGISGILFALTGWLPYTGDGSATDILHNIAIYSSVVGYIVMIWLVKTHDNHRIKKITTYSLGFIVVSALLALFSLIIVSKYEAIAELLILVTIQVWTLLVVWHSRDEFKA